MTVTQGERILFFRDELEADPYKECFSGAGYEALFIPVLRTTYHSPRVLEKAVQDPPPDAVVVTSRRSLEALGQDIRTLTTVVEKWGGVPWYAVGPVTAQAAARLGVNVQPVVPGPSVGLVDPILQSGARHVLFLTGNPHRQELEQALEQHAIDVSMFVLYSTSISEPERLPSGAGWAVIFSPRGAQAVCKQLSAHPNLRRAAIGPTTASALHELGVPAHAVADFPDPESLFKSISLCH